MAKRGTGDHPKTKRLGRAIGLPAWAALGLLEAFWHWVSRYCPTGFITPDEMMDCADTIRFDGDLAGVMVASGWLDEVDGGYYVHDWHDHADDTTKKALERKGERFANGSVTRNSKPKSDNETEARQKRESVATKSPLPEPSQSHSHNQIPEPIPPKPPRGTPVDHSDGVEIPESLKPIEGFCEAWQARCSQRHAKTKTRFPTAESVKAELRQLEGCRDPVAVLNRAVAAGWQGLNIQDRDRRDWNAPNRPPAKPDDGGVWLT